MYVGVWCQVVCYIQVWAQLLFVDDGVDVVVVCVVVDGEFVGGFLFVLQVDVYGGVVVVVVVDDGEWCGVGWCIGVVGGKYVGGVVGYVVFVLYEYVGMQCVFVGQFVVCVILYVVGFVVVCDVGGYVVVDEIIDWIGYVIDVVCMVEY